MKAWHIIVIILSVLTLGLYTQPLVQRNNELKITSQSLDADIRSMGEQLTQIVNIQKEKAESKNDFIKNIPLLNEQENIIRDIESLTLRNGYSFQSLSFVKGQNPVVGIPEIQISFATEGNKKNLVKFLEAIESNPRFLGMKSLSVNTRIEGTEQIATFGVSLYAFYQKDL